MGIQSLEFFRAIREGNYRHVGDMLKRKSVKPDVRDVEYPTRPTALIIAAEQNNEILVEILLHFHPDVDIEDKAGKRAVW